MSDKRRRFEALAMPHLDAANNLARWLARPPLEADDIVQDAMLRAYKAFDGFRGTDAKPWLLAIVRNCFLTAIGRTRPGREVPLPAEDRHGGEAPVLVADDPDPEANAIQAEEKKRLDAIIAGLPREFREVLILREMEDLSYRDIAEITGIPIGTVMSRLARARALVKETWLDGVKGNRHAMQ